MQAIIRRKLAMGARVLDFIEAHPSTDVSYNGVVGRLRERLARADALAMDQEGGRAGERGAVARRRELRAMAQQQLRHLVNVAQAGVPTHPELAGLFWQADSGGPHKAFAAAAHTMLTAALSHRETLLGLGIGETLLEELTASLAQFDEATEMAHSGKRSHVGASAELNAVCDECVLVVGLLDGLNRLRFKNDPNALAAWESARNVAGPFQVHRPKGEPEQPPAADPTPVSPDEKVA